MECIFPYRIGTGQSSSEKSIMNSEKSERVQINLFITPLVITLFGI